MKHVIIERADGGVSHMRCADDADVAKEVEAWGTVNRNRPAVAWREVDVLDLPPRRYRNAWKMQDGKLGVDLHAAKAIRLVELEAKRAEAVAKLRDEIEAAEDNAPSAIPQLKAKRRALRGVNLAARVAAANNTEDLDRIGAE